MNRCKITGAWLAILLVFPACLTAQTDQTVNGWTRSDNVRTYSAETLWDYINGAADYFLTYNFSELKVTEYFRAEDEYIKVEIYNHRDPLNAFGIYAYERPPDVEYLPLGSEAYRIHSTLNFCCSHYYVKVLSHQTDQNTLATLLKLAEIVAGELTGAGEEATLLNLLPQENKRSHSEKFFPENYLGYGFLIQAVEAEYTTGEEGYKLFVIEQSAPEDIRKILSSYLQFAGVDTDLREGKVISLEDMFHGNVYLLMRGNCLYGIYDTENEDLAVSILGVI